MKSLCVALFFAATAIAACSDNKPSEEPPKPLVDFNNKVVADTVFYDRTSQQSSDSVGK